MVLMYQSKITIVGNGENAAMLIKQKKINKQMTRKSFNDRVNSCFF